jgi:hypothetical protein
VAAPFKPAVKVLLEKDCEFAIGIRGGRVLELRPEGYLVFWEGWTDPDTGECHESNVSIFGYDDIVSENNFGTLKIIKRPLATTTDLSFIRRSERLRAEVLRQRFRKSYVLAIQAMLDEGSLKLTRDDFRQKVVSISAKGHERYQEYLTSLAFKEGTRGGA